MQESQCKSEKIAELEQEIKELKWSLLEHQEQIRENESYRRKLHNTIQELKGVFITNIDICTRDNGIHV